MYGISQNPDTKDYIIICQDMYFSGNKKIDDLIQEMQSKRSSHDDITFEWIPYNQLDNIEETSKGDFATVYSAVWKNGLLTWNEYYKEYTRKTKKLAKPVALRCIHNSQIITNEFLNEVWNFLIFYLIY